MFLLQRYADVEIPNDCIAIWSYLAEAYKQAAFYSTMPSDQDIVHHYEKKVPQSSKIRNLTTEKFTYNMYIPEEVLTEIERRHQVQQVQDNNGMQAPVEDPVPDNNGTMDSD